MQTIEQLFSEHAASRAMDVRELHMARADFMAGAAAMAALFAAQPVSVTVQGAPPGSGGPTWLTPEQLENMRANGLDPLKEFGPFDPRASRPRCTHGKFFTEHCEHCDKGGDPPPGSDIDGT